MTRPAAAGLLLALVLANAAVAQTLEARRLRLSGLDPTRDALELSNVGGSAVDLELVSLNGRAIFHDGSELWAEIEALPPDPFADSLATRIFRFVFDNHAHADPLTNNFSWLLAPPLFFNSAGLGMCGQASDLIALLASERGIPARVWAVNDHIVSELFSDGAWHMYDADYGVFFGNRAGGVASVAELEADGTLITSPEWTMATRFPPYTSDYAALFTNSTGNATRPAQPSTFPVARVRLVLPPGGSVRFPGRFAPPPPDRTGAPSLAHRDLALRWPPGVTGPVAEGLILHTLRGAGTLELAGRLYAVGSAALQTTIDQRFWSLASLRVRETSEPLETLYLLNPSRFFAQADNELDVRVTPGARLALGVAPASDPADDLDGDGVADVEDDCPRAADPAQLDADGDGVGNACDADLDQNGRFDATDLAALRACRAGVAPPPSDPTCAESDLTADGVVDANDELRWNAVSGYVPGASAACGIGPELLPILLALQAAAARAAQDRGVAARSTQARARSRARRSSACSRGSL